MRLAIITSVFPPRHGGLATAARELALQAHAHGNAVTVLTPDYGERRGPDPLPGVSVRYLRPAARWGNAAWLPQLARELAPFDVVHLVYPFFGGAEAVLGYRRRGGKLLLHYQMDTVGRGLQAAVFSAYRRVILPRLLRAADRIVVSSMDYAEGSQLQPWFGQIRSKLVAIPNGVEADRFTPGEEPVLARRYGLAGSRVVLFVGGLDAAHYFKGLEHLITAVSLLPDDVRLLVVGRGERQTHFQRLAAAAGIGDRVQFVSTVSDVALPAHYRLADVVVLPSVDRSEAFGIVLLEAMACGKPTVASRLPGVRTVVRAGVTGVLAPPADVSGLAGALRRLLTHPDEARRMGAAGRAVVQREYDWSVVGDRINEVYAQLG